LRADRNGHKFFPLSARFLPVVPQRLSVQTEAVVPVPPIPGYELVGFDILHNLS
jgi:hypothetical protein